MYLDGKLGMDWHQMVNGLEEHLWMQRAARIMQRYTVAAVARFNVQGPLSEDDRWEILRWAAHREETST